MRVGIFARVTDVNRDWLAIRVAEDGLPLWEILDALLNEARKDGCTFRGRPAEIVRP